MDEKDIVSVFEASLSLDKTKLNFGKQQIGKLIASPEGTEAFVNALSLFPTVKTIIFENNYVRPEAVAFIIERNHYPPLTSISLWKNSSGSGAAGRKAIADALLINSTLQTLSLQSSFSPSNLSNDEGFEAMANALAINSTLQSLDLSFNSLWENGGSQVGKIMSMNFGLRSLNLFRTTLKDGGVIALAQGLSSHLTLQNLNISECQFSEKGLKEIVQLLSKNTPPLQSLQLKYNEFGKEGGPLIANALYQNSTLKSLDVRHNMWLDLNPILRALLTNSTLEDLQATRSKMQEDRLEKLLSLMGLSYRQEICSWMRSFEGNETLRIRGNPLQAAFQYLLEDGEYSPLFVSQILKEAMVKSKVMKNYHWFVKDNELLDLSLRGFEISHIAQMDWFQIGKVMPSLKTINLGHNELIAIPSCLSRLPNLQDLSIDLSHNPLQGFSAQLQKHSQIHSYLVTMATSSGGLVPYKEVKLVVVGEAAAGKTTLLRSLRGVGGKVLKNMKNISTDGVDLGSVEFEGCEVRFCAWDFGGQEIYRYTHQLFLSPNSICLVVFDLRTPVDEALETLKFWFQILAQRAAGAQCILVGTHASILNQEVAKRKLDQVAELIKREEYGNMIQGSNTILMIDSISGLNLSHLKKLLIDLGTSLSEDQKVPQSLAEAHILLQGHATKLIERRQIPVVDEVGFQDCLKGLNLRERVLRELVPLLSFVGAISYVKWMEYEAMVGEERAVGGGELVQKMLIVLDPKWLTELLTTIITFRYNLAQSGVVLKSKLYQTWRSSDIFQQSKNETSFFNGLLKLLNDLDVVLSLDEDKVLVPCLLPESKPFGWPRGLRSDDIVVRRSFLITEGKTLSAAILARLHGVLLKGTGTKKKISTWKTGCIVYFLLDHQLSSDSPEELIVALYKESVLFSGEEGVGTRRRNEAIHLLIGQQCTTTKNFPSNISNWMRSLVYTVKHLLSEFSFGPEQITQLIPLSEKFSDWLEFEKIQEAVVALHSLPFEKDRSFYLETARNKTKIGMEKVLLLCPDVDLRDLMKFIPRECLALKEAAIGSGGFADVYEGMWSIKLN